MTVPTAPPADQLDVPAGDPPPAPMGFRGVALPLNTMSGDGRVFTLADGAPVQLVPLPMPLMWQEQSSAEGHAGSFIVGRIESAEVRDGGVYVEGRLNPDDPRAREVARTMANGFGGWVSADMDMCKYTVEYIDGAGDEVMPDDVDAALDDGEDVTARRVFSQWRLSGATLVSGPAFPEAKLEVCDVAELGNVDADAPFPTPPALVAAADGEVHKGGMIALVPSAEDQKRLAVPGGAPPEQLHTTLAYLGDDCTGWTDEQRQACVDAVQKHLPGVMDGKVMGHAAFNPDAADDPDRDPCAVYLTETPGMTGLRGKVVDALKSHPDVPVTDETDTFDAFVPHITAGYGLGPADLSETGPIRYDRMRVAIGGQQQDIPLEPVTAGLVAAAVVYPLEHFADPQLDGPTPITVDTATGEIYGHVAAWGTCHIGMRDCVTPPQSATNYSYFHQGAVDTDAGILPVGRITMDTGHADVYQDRAAATRHYDHTGTCVGVVRAGEDAHGIWIHGRTLPGLSDSQIATLRRSSLSGDWRIVDRRTRQRELVAALCVNTPGYPIPRPEVALVASGMAGGMVAAAVVQHPDSAPRRRRIAPRSAHAELVDPSQLDDHMLRAGQSAAEILRVRSEAARQVAAVQRETLARRVDRVRESASTRRRIDEAAALVDETLAAQRRDQLLASVAPVLAEQAARRVQLAVGDVDTEDAGDLPGGRMPPELHRYWTKGAGAAKWVANPHPYTALVAALKATPKIAADMSDQQIHGLAANLYHDVFGKWPGNHDGGKK